MKVTNKDSLIKFGLDISTQNKLQNVFGKFREIDMVIIYGSRAKGNYKEGSDIDLTVKGVRLSLSIINQLSLMIDDLLLPLTVDLSLYSHIDEPELLDHIKKVGKIFYKSE